jgi:hypothetical protein
MRNETLLLLGTLNIFNIQLKCDSNRFTHKIFRKLCMYRKQSTSTVRCNGTNIDFAASLLQRGSVDWSTLAATVKNFEQEQYSEPFNAIDESLFIITFKGIGLE